MLDLIAIIDFILGGTLSDEQQCAADFYNDSIINIVDLVRIVEVILSN